MVYAALVLTIAAGILMVSRFSYYSFKDFDLRERVPFVSLLAVVLIFVFLSMETATVLFSFFFLYMLSGPIVSLFRWNRKRVRLAESKEDTTPDS